MINCFIAGDFCNRIILNEITTDDAAPMTFRQALKTYLLSVCLLLSLVGNTYGQINNTITSGTIAACQGTPSAAPDLMYFLASGYRLNSSLTVSAPAGFEISQNIVSGYTTTITLPRNTANNSQTLIYVRSAANAPLGIINGTVTMSSTGTPNVDVPVRGKVVPVPGIISLPDIVVASGASVPLNNLTGSGIDYYWSNTNPSIGLSAKGHGDIPSFTAVNTTAAPITATLTATPVSSGVAYAVAYVGNNAPAVDLSTNQVQTLIGTANSPVDITVSQDELTFYYISAGVAKLNVRPSYSLINKATVTLPNLPSYLTLSPDDSRLYISSSSANSVTVFNAQTNTIVTSVAVGSSPGDLQVNPVLPELYVINQNSNSVSVISTATNAVTSTITTGVGNQPSSLAVSYDGALLYVSNRSSGTVSVFRTSDPSLVTTISAGSLPSGLCISKDGSRLYISNANSTVAVINTADNSRVATIPLTGRPNGLSLTRDGNWLYVLADDDHINAISTADNVVALSFRIPISAFAHGKFIRGGVICGPGPVKFNVTVYPPGVLPEITVTGSPQALATTAGTPSPSTSFSVSGTNLTAAILLNPPAGFELSTDNSTFGPAVSLGTGGSSGPFTVYIRLKASDAAGNYSGNILLSSPGAATINLAMPLSTVSAPALITAGAASGSVTACVGAPSPAAGTRRFSTSATGLIGPLTLTAPPNFEISLTQASDFAPLLSIPAGAGGDIVSTDIHFRAAAGAPAGGIAGNIMLSSPGAATANVTVAGQVSPLPTVDPVSNQTVLNGTATTAVNFSGSATQYEWSSNQPAIGLAVSGTGNIPSFTAVNTGNTPITASIIVTPLNPATGCQGNAISFTLTVNPAPPAIFASGTPGPLSTVYGSASAGAPFTVSGSNLRGQITITAPTGFEVSAGGAYGSQISVNGSPAPVACSIRLTAADPVGNYSGAIRLSSTGTTDAFLTIAQSAVTPAPLLIKAGNIHKNYGDQLSQGALSGLFTISGLKNNETAATVILTYNSGNARKDHAGVYTSAVLPGNLSGGTFDPANYNLVYLAADLFIDKIPLEIIAENKTRAYQQPNPELTASYRGFITGDDPLTLVRPSKLETTANLNSLPGNYPITASGAFSDDYLISYTAGSLTINALSELKVPNAFTPNSDGINDVWNIENIGNYPSASVNIFSRSGQKVFASNGYGTPWNGRYNDRELPSGTYYYIIDLKNGSKVQSGYVVVLR